MINQSPAIAIIQARMNSSRLPGKTLLKINGIPLLERIIKRIQQCKTLDQIVVATTTSAIDNKIIKLTNTLGIKSYRGSENDVLDRYYKSALKFNAKIIVRITADDPFKDPQIIDTVTNCLIKNARLDYVSNTIVPSFPEGLDVEAFTINALEIAWKNATLQSEREHVTPYIWKNPDKFKIKNILNASNLSHLRWTLDYAEDLKFTKKIYSHLKNNNHFLMNDILDILKKEPQLAKINQGFSRNAGYKLSIKNDYETNH